jgi:hypothetical protein
MKEKIETFIVVTIITVLVWMYAEGESVKTYSNQLIQIEFVAPQGKKLAIDPQEIVRVLATFQATGGQFQVFEDITNRGPIQIEVGEDVVNDHITDTVIISDALAQSDIGNVGLNLIETNPATISLHVEPLTKASLDVSVITGDVQLAQLPSVTPVKVSLLMPVSRASSARDMKIYARLDQLDLASLPVNVPHTLEVPLQVPDAIDGPFVTLEHETVEVTFTIRKQTDTHVLTSVPIHINATPHLLRRYSIQLNDMVVRDVKISGPSDVVEKIRNNEIKVWAEIRPKMEDMETGTRLAQLHIEIPPSVLVVSTLPQVEMQVTLLNGQ